MNNTIYAHTDFEDGSLVAQQVDDYAMITIEGQQHYLPPVEARKLAVWLLGANAYVDKEARQQITKILDDGKAK